MFRVQLSGISSPPLPGMYKNIDLKKMVEFILRRWECFNVSLDVTEEAISFSLD